MGKGVWIKLRKTMSEYPETPQQKKVEVGGQLIKIKCTGKKGENFVKCRSIVLQCAFDDKKCDEELLELKEEVKEEKG